MSKVVKVKELVNSSVVEEKPKKKGKKASGDGSNFYFQEKQEEAFVKYVQSTDKYEKNKIFNEILYPAFTKLVESIIRRYKLFTPNEDFQDTFNDAMSYLLTKVDYFDVTKGKKVYSYIGTVCKNYLLCKRTQYMKLQQKYLSYENLYNENHEDERIDDFSLDVLTFHSNLIANMSSELEKILGKRSFFRDEYGIDTEERELTESEYKVGYALKEMLDNWDEIYKGFPTRKFSKLSVTYFIKEYTLLPSSEIRKAMKKFSKVYLIAKKDFISEQVDI